MAGFRDAAILPGWLPTPARADVVVQIDKSSQRIATSGDGAPRYNRPVSTGRDGFGTPSSIFHPRRTARFIFRENIATRRCRTRSFFHCGFAILGTSDIARLGGPASHGCVRLHPSHAAALFALVEGDGPGHTRIAYFQLEQVSVT